MMNNLKNQLTEQLKEDFSQVGYDLADVTVQFSTYTNLADYQCNTAFSYEKKN